LNFGKSILFGIAFSILLTGFSFSQESFAANTAPTVDVGPDTTINEGESFLYVGSFTDSDADTWTATVDYGDGTGTQPLLFDTDKTFTLENMFENDGVYNVLVTIDDGTTSGIDTVLVTVNNITPSISVDSQYVDATRTLIASGSFSDPGSDTWSATADYGEGAGPIVLTLDPDNSFSISHIFASEGTFPVTITINDGTSDGIEVLSIIVDDDAPISNPGGPYVADEGTSITLDASGSSDDGSIVSYEWDLDNNGLFDDATGVTPSVLFDNESLLGPFIIGLKVTDNDGNSSVSTVAMFVNNVIPILSVSPDSTTLDEGGTFTGSGSFVDPGNDLFSGSVDYGDGEDVDMTLVLTTSKTFVLDHTYKQNGVYTVLVTVSDSSQEGTVTETFDVTVNNVAPTVVPGTGTTIPEGDSFATSGSFSDPGDDDWVVSVDYDDGSVIDFIAFNPDKTFDIGHTFATYGTFDIVVSVDDGDVTTTESFTVTVTNVAPLVDAGFDGNISEGSEFSSVGFVTDPGSESFTATVDYGDGTGVLPLTINGDNSFDLSHTYENNGAYTISVLVNDGISSSHDSATVTVTNVTPVISVGSSVVDENRLYESTGSFMDPGSDVWTGTVNYGDGSGDLSLLLNPDMTFDLSHSYSTNGAYSVLVSINDGDSMGSLPFTVGIFVSSGGSSSGLNSPIPSNTTVSGNVVFETDGQDIWSPVTGSSDGVSWDLFTPQLWDESTPTIGHFQTFGSKKFASKTIGVGMDMGTSGHLEMFSQVDDLKGTVDVTYPGNVDLTHADINSFLAGETTDISSAWKLSPSATIDAHTTGDLELSLDMGLHTFLTTKACLLNGCSDLFDVDPINFDTTPTVLFAFDDSNAVNSIPEFVQRALFKSSAVFSSVDVKPSTSSVNVATGVVTADDTNLFSTMAIDIDKIFTTLVTAGFGCPSFPIPPCVTLGEHFSIDKTTLSWDYFDATSDIDFIANQELTFDSDVLVKLDFDRPIAGVLGSLVDVTSDGTGVTSVTYRSGDNISITFPEGETDPITVTPTVLLDPTKTKLHNFAKVSTDSDVTMTAGFADYSIQSFQVFPPFTLSYPHLLGHWHCHDRVLGVCYNWHSHSHTHHKDIGGVNFPGFSLPTLGPLWNSGPQGNVVKVNVISDEEFDLGGFNTVQLTSFLLDPEVPPTAIITAPPVDEGSTVMLDASRSFDVDIPAEPLTYSWDLNNDGLFDDATGITVEFSNTADGPATHPISLQVCDPYNCDIDSGTVKVLNVNPTVEAGNADSADEGALYDYTAKFTDPGFDCSVCGTSEDFTSTVDWGDNTGIESLVVNETSGSLGTLTQGTAYGSHTYADDGVYTVTITVTDDDAGVGSDSFDITINNVNPTVDAGADQEAVIHDTVSLDPATYSDPGFDCSVCGTSENFTSIVNWGDFSSEPLTVTEIPGSVGVLTEGTASGSHIYRLPGDYTVTVTVDDDDAGSTSDSLITTVLGAQDLKNRAISFLTPFNSEKKVEKSIKEINKSLESELWLSNVYLDEKHGKKVFDEEKNAVKELQELLKDGAKKGIDPDLEQAAKDSTDLLVNADRVLTITIMLDASSTPADDIKKQKKVDEENEKSSKEFTKADGYRDDGDYDKAIDHYKKAWEHSQDALKHASK